MHTASFRRLARKGARWVRRPFFRVALHLLVLRMLLLPVPVVAAPQRHGILVAELPAGTQVSAEGHLLNFQGAEESPSPPPKLVSLRALQQRSRPDNVYARILVTGYSSTVDQTDATPFVTASGSRVHDGTIAINVFPFGTRVRFLNYRPNQVFTVEDRHHPRLSVRADIWFPSRRAAVEFGARVLEMVVVEGS